MNTQTILIALAALVVLYLLFRIFKAIIKWVIIALVVLLGVAYFSNPNEEDHKKSLKEIAKDLKVKIREKTVGVDDYKIFSLTKVKFNGEERVVGIGVFGKVWYFDELEKKLDRKKESS